MKLSKDQIIEIKDFIHSRGFTHIEVEMEILDHVATAVEEKLDKDPTKSLSSAIQEVHGSFGPLGFSTFEEGLNKTIGKLLNNELIKHLKYYTIGTGVLTTFLVFALCYLAGLMLLPFQEVGMYRLIFYALGLSVSLMSYFKIRRISKKWFKKSMVIARTGSYSIASFVILGQGAGLFLEELIPNNLQLALILFAFCSASIICYGMIYLKLFRWSFEWTNERYLKYAE